jgi:glycosyltransferase involved in cell wall biosynthesis
MTPPPQHLIVIPAFNEERTIGRVVAAARRHGSVVVVDDGSTDATSARAHAAGGLVVAHRHRSGKGAAIQTGAALARQMGAAWMVTLDGDGQHDPEAIPLLLATADRTSTAIVIAGRLGSASGMPRVRLLACRAAGFFINRLTQASIRDTQSGFRCYPVRLFEEIRLRSGGFVLETELLVAGANAGWTLLEVDVAATHRTVRPSRFHPLADGVAIGAYLAARILARSMRGLRSRRPARPRAGARLSRSAGQSPGVRAAVEDEASHRFRESATREAATPPGRGEPPIPSAREAEGRP